MSSPMTSARGLRARAGRPFATSASDNAGAMSNDQSGDVLGDDERAIAQRLIDEINEFNLKATGIAQFHEMLIVESDGDGELAAGVYGWCSRRDGHSGRPVERGRFPDCCGATAIRQPSRSRSRRR